MATLLDLFCGAGGTSMGYHRAGFTVTGVDLVPQPHYPFAFVQADALEYVAAHGHEYDVIHASPPCQGYSLMRHLPWLKGKTYPLLIEPVRTACRATGKPWVIENVIGAPLDTTLLLCGSMFALQTTCGAQLRRHRLFESNILLLSPGPCQHAPSTISVHGDHPHNPTLRRAQYPRGRTRTISVTGSTPQQNVEYNRLRETFSVQEARIAMGISWMPMRMLSQAIPPAYTEWIGTSLLAALTRRDRYA